MGFKVQAGLGVAGHAWDPRGKMLIHDFKPRLRCREPQVCLEAIARACPKSQTKQKPKSWQKCYWGT